MKPSRVFCVLGIPAPPSDRTISSATSSNRSVSLRVVFLSSDTVSKNVFTSALGSNADRRLFLTSDRSPPILPAGIHANLSQGVCMSCSILDSLLPSDAHSSESSSCHCGGGGGESSSEWDGECGGGEWDGECGGGEWDGECGDGESSLWPSRSLWSSWASPLSSRDAAALLFWILR